MATIANSIQKTKAFFNHDLWQINNKSNKWNRAFRQILRVSIISLQGFISNKNSLKASALTFYTILSVVPVLAVAFGVAQGFGLEDKLEEQIRESFAGQEEVMTKIIEFSRKSLKNVQGGLVAGISILFLLWSVIKLLNHIENAFNSIWNLTKSRTFIRKFTDYLSLILLGPVFIIISGSVTVFINTKLQGFTTEGMFFEFTNSFLVSLMQLAPFVLIWILFTILYMIIPNKNVRFLPALAGGILAGTAFAFLQNGYVYFQLAMSRYNAIYGSFAALPLFLIWLQISWLFILFGAEVSHAVQYTERLIFSKQNKDLSLRINKMLCINVLKEIAKNFESAHKAHTIDSISEKLEMPTHLVEQSITHLVKANLLVEIANEGSSKSSCYQPAVSTNHLNLVYVNKMLESAGLNEVGLNNNSKFNEIAHQYSEFENALQNDAVNKLITQL